MSYNKGDSSSDDEAWMRQSRPSGPTATSGQNAMLEARRRALQQQREAQQAQQQQQQQQRAQGSSRQPPAAGRLGARQPAPTRQVESALPDIFGGSDDEATQQSGSPASAMPAARPPPSAPSVAPAPVQPAATHEDTLEQLQRQVAAQQKVLQATREREVALTERWRAAKAQKQAEVEQLNGKLRRVWASAEDEKSASETKIRESQDAHEAELRAARREVEQAVKAEYETKMTEAQQQLDAAKREEANLRELLAEKSGGGGAATKNLVNTALSAAVSAVLRRLDDVFTSEEAEGLRMDAWRSELQSLVQREIQTSFAVGVESETQAERVEYARFFEDMLAFWRSAEDQERARLLKMDEALLADLQGMAQQDLRRLQDEALGMERVYVESREAWAMEHQRLLQRELEATLQRREAELQEQRRQRHSLHVDRLRDIEARHKDVMGREEALHQKHMEQLRAYFGREEDLRAEQQRVQAAALEDVTKSTALVREVLATAEEAAAAVKVYEQALEEGRRRGEAEREEQLKEQVDMLERLRQLAATQCSNTDAERAALEDSASQLRLVSQSLERHLLEEDAWLAQQETSGQRSKEEWEREYRRWQHLVQQERQAAEERFHEALLALQQSMGLLDTEEREVAVEAAALHRCVAEMEALAQKETEALRRRAAEVETRSIAVEDLHARLSQQRTAAAEAKGQLVEAQQRLEDERAELHLDEERLRDMTEVLRLARSQAELRRYEVAPLCGAAVHAAQAPSNSAAAVTPAGAPQHPAVRGGATRVTREHSSAPGEAQTAVPLRRRKQHRDPHRLPNRVLRELSEQLGAFATGAGGDVFVPTMRWTDPEPMRAEAPPPRVHEVRSRRRADLEDALVADAPAPLAAPPTSFPRGHHTARRDAGTRTQHIRAAPEQRHAELSSVPHTSDNSSQLSLRADEWSSGGNTFTNLLGFSDLDTSSQSMQ
ncbi:hypothetical protein NESM_000189600 [Novymonas esmeraldas]|uniref:Uncharacterized protein n=1 Tax=Novymonas esmeraldas TaxID=1808958 RepID=A0AAW0F4V1_9TRYP